MYGKEYIEWLEGLQADDSIPQNSEGVEFLSVPIPLKYTSGRQEQLRAFFAARDDRDPWSLPCG